MHWGEKWEDINQNVNSKNFPIVFRVCSCDMIKWPLAPYGKWKNFLFWLKYQMSALFLLSLTYCLHCHRKKKFLLFSEHHFYKIRVLYNKLVLTRVVRIHFLDNWSTNPEVSWVMKAHISILWKTYFYDSQKNLRMEKIMLIANQPEPWGK